MKKAAGRETPAASEVAPRRHRLLPIVPPGARDTTPALADFLDAGIVWTGSALPSRTTVMAQLRSRITSNELVVGGGRRDVST